MWIIFFQSLDKLTLMSIIMDLSSSVLHINNLSSLIQTINITEEEFFRLYKLEKHSPVDEYFALEVQTFLLDYIPPVLVIFGVLGNILSLLVFRSINKFVSTYSYLNVLAVMDICVMIVGPLRMWISGISSMDFQDMSHGMCKIVAFVGYVSSDCSAWIVVAVSVDRYVVICSDIKASSACRQRKTRLVILAIICMFCAINSHLFWTVELKGFHSNTTSLMHCDASSTSETFINSIWPWFDATLYSFLPFCIILVFNVRMVHNLLSANRLMKRVTRRPKTMKTAHRKLNVLLLVLSFLYITTTLPYNVVLIATVYFNKSSQSNQTAAIFGLVRTISMLLMYSNHAINFFLYCMIGQDFRKHLSTMLCGERLRRMTISRETQQVAKPTQIVQ